jgi:hypothetical protein
MHPEYLSQKKCGGNLPERRAVHIDSRSQWEAGNGWLNRQFFLGFSIERGITAAELEVEKARS